MKKWYNSATLWTNAVLLLLIVVEEVINSGVLPKEYTVYAIVLLNILLRFKTNKGITL
jgi:hypothetical protein